jgi:HK97 family phage portal protein
VSFLGSLLRGRGRSAALTAESFPEGFWECLGIGPSAAGTDVNFKTALQTMAVLGCVRVLAEGVGQVPLKLFKARRDGGSDVAFDHPLYRVLYRRPNPWQTSLEFREMMVAHVALAGRFVAFKSVASSGRIMELIPFLPNEVSVEVDTRRNVTYRVSSEITGESAVFPAEAIWHVKGLSWNGWDGLKPLQLAREAVGLSLATEKAHALLHANGAQPGGLYSVDGTLGKDQYQALRNWITQNLSGENRFKPLILDRGAKFITTAMTGVDAQHLETRKFQIEEVCRAFRVFPQMIGYSDKTSTFASAEAFFIAHVVHTLMPWYERIEQSIDCNLLTEKDAREGIYAKFIPNALLRGTAKDRAEFYKALWEMGALSPNEIRAMEEMNPYEGGGTYRVQLNLTDASKPTPDPVAPAAAGKEENEPPQKPSQAQKARVAAGRVLSARNERRIRDAQDSLEQVLGELDKQEQE